MDNACKVLCVISARGGSKGIPGKNLKPLGGRPLIDYAFQKARRATLVDRVVCSTDDDAIARIARERGIELPGPRPPELADDATPLVAVTQFVMRAMDTQGFRADIIVQLTPTSPFLKHERIDESIRLVMAADCDSAVSLKRIEHEHPYRARRLREDGCFENFIQDANVEAIHSRQDLPALYCTSGALYTRKRRLLERYDGKDFAMGEKRKAIVVDDLEAVNLDRPIDFHFAEFLMHQEAVARALV